MKKTAIAISIAVLAAGVGIFAITRYARWEHIQIPIIVPDAKATNVADLFPAKSSQLVITARIPFSGIRELAQKTLPGSIGGEIHVPDTAGISGITVRPDLAVDPLKLDPVVGSAPPRVNIATGLHGRVNAKAFKWIIIDALVGKIKTKSPDISADIDLGAHIDGWVSPGISQDWSLIHQEHIDVHIDKASGSTLFGVIHFDARQKLQESVNNAFPGIIKRSLDSVAATLHLQANVEKIWNELSKPLKIADDPPTYLLFQPEQARLQQIAFDNPQTLTIRLALDGKCLTLIDKAPESPKTPALSLLVQQPTINPEFRAAVPLAIRLSEANRSIRSRQQLPISVKLDQNSSVDVRDVSLYSEGKQLYVKATIHGENRSIQTVADGDVLLRGWPDYDEATQHLRLKDVSFDLKTKGVLQNVAAWLLNDLICNRIEKAVQLDIAEATGQLRRKMNSHFSSVQPSPGLRLTSTLNKLNLTGVETRDDLLLLSFDLAGQVSCDLSPDALKR